MAMTDFAPARAAGERTQPPSLRERLAPPVPGGALLSWLGPLLVTLFAGFLRFDRLDKPKAVVFDETYYAKDALALLKFGWEHNTVKDADKLLIADPNANIWASGASFIAHPPGGKWMIAIGEWLFGATPFGWRFTAALCGTLSVLILCRVARRMTGSTLLGCAAGLLLALDGLHFVTSRAALLDIFVMFWVLAGFACLVADRDRSRRRLAERIEAGSGAAFGPFLAHGWRLLAGVCLGMACATKWTGIFYVAAFGIMVVFWDYGARRAAGVREPLPGALLLDAIPAFGQLVVVGAITYLATWWGWIFKPGGWGRGEVAGFPLARPFEALPDLWKYHAEIFNFHTGLDSKHPYQSWPWDWPVLRRPVAFFYTEPKGACEAEKCSREILGIGTPVLWWGAMAALLVIIGIWLVRRDWRAGAILLGYLAGWVSWFPSALSGRTMFLFYATPMLPFMVLAVVLALGYLIGPAASAPEPASRGLGLDPSSGRPALPFGATAVFQGRNGPVPGRRILGAAVAGAFVLLVLANFAYFYPILAAKIIPYDAWDARIWLRTWI
ncbi:phospholipid carrier-dependent glycosyltransferase [Actinomadura viridis]|uniref:Polyprenol-phosphate-mannose--protein mannosyltransferase n=1 Tax=Actinomadura viridis TaxID=58110 RepID=A0A931DBE1_9ACTN|nr:phospholipid carrier-dependent glycosyltransferase [Actinomadura viridis]MBG6087070.1 dolichyl-phosphate-mannose--protein O-mannosyl transferase [Actinomadura viridis]